MARARTTDDAPPAPRVRSDAYVGLLALALVAQIAGAIFLYMDWSAYPQTTPPKVAAAPSAAPPAPVVPQPPPGGAQGVPAPIPMP